ncbi:MAG: DegV family EDD domain-containing protein [Clostridia bacterium]|nr:DegV family EDD domain-containing protein [Clostridia bacterium]
MLELSKVRIVADSSADLLVFDGVETAFAPLKIHTEEKEYVDTAALDVSAMTHALSTYRGKATTACPSMGDFLQAFGEAEYIFCLTMTSKLSATYTVALSAAREYAAQHPDRRVCVIDSRNTGPGMRLLAEKIVEWLREGMEFDEIEQRINGYRFENELLFLLESLSNLANSGRVSRTVAKIAGLLGIRMLGRAVDGQIKPVAKPRGESKALDTVFEQMLQLGYCGGKVRISHCENEFAAAELADRIKKKFPEADIIHYPARALCSFYAERGGLILGFEIDDETGGLE